MIIRQFYPENYIHDIIEITKKTPQLLYGSNTCLNGVEKTAGLMCLELGFIGIPNKGRLEVSCDE